MSHPTPQDEGLLNIFYTHARVCADLYGHGYYINVHQNNAKLKDSLIRNTLNKLASPEADEVHGIWVYTLHGHHTFLSVVVFQNRMD